MACTPVLRVALMLAICSHDVAGVSVRRQNPVADSFQDKMAKFAAAMASAAPGATPAPSTASFQATLTKFVKDAAQAQEPDLQKESSAAPVKAVVPNVHIPVASTQVVQKPLKLTPLVHNGVDVRSESQAAPVVQAIPSASTQAQVPVVQQLAPAPSVQQAAEKPKTVVQQNTPATHIDMTKSQKQQTKAAQDKPRRKQHHTEAIFHALLNDWKQVPALPVFVERCTTLLHKLLPELRREYTMNNVPKVLLHECDVYTTKEDYVLHNVTNLVDARDSCRYAARRLGNEYLGDQDYTSWCTDLHEYLEEETKSSMRKVEAARLLKEQQALKAELEAMRKDYGEIMSKRGAIGRHLDGISNGVLPCCPEDCQICSL